MSKVLIVGGGIAGLATAIALRHVGVRSIVLEKSPALSEIGAGITLWSNAMLCLRAMGLEADVIRAGTPVVEGNLLDWRGRLLVKTPVEAIGIAIGAPSIAIHRGLLARILTDALEGVKLRYDACCAAIQQDNTMVTAILADGSKVQGEMLIGADGLRSIVLAELFGAQPLRYSGHTCFRGVADLDDESLPPGSAFESWAPRRRFGAVRLGDRRVYWFANVSRPSGWTPLDNKTWLAQEFAAWHAPVAQLIDNTIPAIILQHDIYDRPPRRDHWGRGRVTLVGDACHPMTPNLGQGGCQALEDAIALANMLATNGVNEQALRSYEQDRYPRAAALVRQSYRQGWISQRPTRIECAIRDFCTRLVPKAIMTNVFRRLVTIQEPKLPIPPGATTDTTRP